VRAIFSLMCLAIPIATSADTRSPIDRARAIDPGHDAGTLLPRADTLDEGTITAHGSGMVGARTISCVPLADAHGSVRVDGDRVQNGEGPVMMTAVRVMGTIGGPIWGCCSSRPDRRSDR